MRYRRVFVPGASYFFTLVTHERAPIFSDPSAVNLYRRVVRKVQAAWPFTLHAEVILPDHIHLLCTLPDGDADYPTRVRLIKTGFTRAMRFRLAGAELPTSRLAKGESRCISITSTSIPSSMAWSPRRAIGRIQRFLPGLSRVRMSPGGGRK
jgi:putative transposase